MTGGASPQSLPNVGTGAFSWQKWDFGGGSTVQNYPTIVGKQCNGRT
jgi:hypothetical protein